MPRVLILFNDRQLAKRAGEYLKIKGYDTDIHTDPQQAILAADTNLFDIAVVDINLAGRSGIEFLYELRSYREWQEIPVIVVGLARLGEIQDFLPSLGQLNVAQYLPLALTPLPRLEAKISRLLQPVPSLEHETV